MIASDDTEITMDTVRQCAPVIRNYMNRESLTPYLMQCQLLTDDEMYHFTSDNMSPGESCNYLLKVLETKHSKSAQIFYQCLQMEPEHLGHSQIVESLRNTALQLQGNIHAVVKSSSFDLHLFAQVP